METYEDTVTQLSPEEENQFMAWAGEMRLAGKIHPQDDFSDYDMRGYWKETGGKGTADKDSHFPDTYKRPNHPTFSVESKYAQGKYKAKYGSMAGSWDGDNFLPPVSDEELYNTYVNEQDEYRNLMNQKKQLEEMYGIQIPDDDISTSVPKNATQGLAGKTVEEIANAKDMSPTFVDTLCDISYSLFYGLNQFGVSLAEMGMAAGKWVAEKQTGTKIDFDVSKEMDKYSLPEPTTTAGAITGGLTQAVTGWVGAPELKIAGLAKTAYASKFLNGLANVVRGFTADTMAFRANDANFAELLKAFNLPSVEALAKQTDDSFLTKKIKNGLDGAVVGLVADAMIKSAKMFYKAGKQAIDNRKIYEGIIEYPINEKGIENVVDAEFNVVNPKEIPMTAKEVQGAVSEGKMIEPRKETMLYGEKPNKLQIGVSEKTTADKIADDFKNMIGASDERAKQFAKAIESKDYDFLVDYLSNTDNKKSRAIFEKYTGIKLPNKKGESEKAVVEWAGKNYDRYKADKEELFKSIRAEREASAKKEAFKSAEKNLSGKTSNYNGRIMSTKDAIENIIDDGFDTVSKKGPYYRLQKSDGSYITFKGKDEKLYIDYLLNQKKGGK